MFWSSVIGTSLKILLGSVILGLALGFFTDTLHPGLGKHIGVERTKMLWRCNPVMALICGLNGLTEKLCFLGILIGLPLYFIWGI